MAGAFALVLLLGWFAYRPGLSGGFLFDDFVNLPVLGYYGRIDNWTAFWLYITSGAADPTGRPVAMLSFLIDANDWPADPYSFKRTGVLLHLLNGALLTWLLLKLGRASGRTESTALRAAVLGAALWLLHPLMISTTLYVVQRETVLAGTFILFGLLGYVSGRELAVRGSKSGVWLAFFSIAAATVLAVLSKANGALLPLLTLLLERLLLAPTRPVDHSSTRRGFTRLSRLILLLPSCMIGAFLIWKAYSGFLNGVPAMRPWTLGERLLTEPRVLLEYLRLLWLPRAFSHGLFNDDLVASSGLFSPPSTFLALLLLTGLMAFAWGLRRRQPTISLALLFFFAGHLLESTVIPLELYFEHRNYTPALLMFWPLALWISGDPTFSHSGLSRSRVARVMRFALGVLLPLVFAGLTYIGADLWGNARDQALLWAAQNPQSGRAQATAAQALAARGEPMAALAMLERALVKQPNELQLLFNLVSLRCQTSGLSRNDIRRTENALRTARNAGRIGADWFERALGVAQAGTCPGLDLDVLDGFLSASAENPNGKRFSARFVQDRIHLQARIALLRHENERALSLFNAALDVDPRPEAGLQQAAILASAGQPQLALRHLDYLIQRAHSVTPGWTMPSLHAWLLWKSGYWDNEMAHLRKTLEHDVEEQGRAHPPGSK